MIHEVQVRQYCAIHAVNNLLQLPSALDYDAYRIILERPIDDGREGRMWEAGDGGMRKWGRRAMASSSEYDAAADTHVWTCRDDVLCRLIPYSSFSIAEDDVGATPGEDDCKDETGSGGGTRIWRAGTRREFDDIALGLSMREDVLLGGWTSYDDDADVLRDAIEGATLLRRMRCKYGTPYLGNYSIDVMREALGRRGVSMDYYRVPTNDDDVVDAHDGLGSVMHDDTGDNDEARNSTFHGRLIGFVVHTNETTTSRKGTWNISSSLSWMAGRIPVLRDVCGVGRHWHAITGVRYEHHRHRRRANGEDSDSDDASRVDGAEKKDSTAHNTWHLIDSKVSDKCEFRTDVELMDYFLVQIMGLFYLKNHHSLRPLKKKIRA
jgi:hypothetical protein